MKKSWNLTDTDGRLGMVALEAVCCGPQRVTLDGEVDLVVISPEEYARLTGEPLAAPTADPGTAPKSALGMFAEFRRLMDEAAGEKDLGWPWDWDCETREWVLLAGDPVSTNATDVEVPMKEWELADARKYLDAVTHLAVTSGPQRISNGSQAVVVLDAQEYDRMIRGIEPTTPPYDERGEPISFVEFMRNSPLAEAFREGAFTEEEWDAACRIGR